MLKHRFTLPGRRWLRRAAVAAAVGAVVAAVTTVASVMWVRESADDHIFTEQTVPEAPVALVLGAQVSGRDPVHLGRHETGVEDALRAG